MDHISQELIEHYPEIYERLSTRYHQARFGSLKGQYDLHETIALVYDLFRDFSLDPRTLKVLDIACGTGKVSIPIAQAGADVTCLDVSPGMLKQCYQRAIEAGVERNIHLELASADRLPYETGTFDLVISSRFLHLFPKWKYPALINEMLRIVKPNGYVVVEIKNKHYGFFIGQYKGWRRVQAGKPISSVLSLKGIRRLNKKLVDGRIEKVAACQLPKGYLFAPYPALAALVRRLCRTMMSPIAFYYFMVIRKCP